MQNVVKIIILFVFFLQACLVSCYKGPSFHQFFHSLGLRDIYFPEIRFVKGLKNLAFLPREDNSISLR